MKVMTALASLLILTLLVIPTAAPTPTAGCEFGRVQGFVQIKEHPLSLAGAIPSKFSFSQRYFMRRFNCKHRSAAVRRVDLGTYDVLFPGLGRRGVFASAVSLDGVAASATYIGPGIYRVVLRGPLVRDNVLERRDVAFSLAVF